MTKRFVVGGTALVAALVAWLPLAHAAPVPVRFTEGVMHGFPVLRSAQGERLASGELTQVARGDVVESRLVFRFQDGSLYDETVVFSQRDVFKIDKYRLVQRGPSFPESVEASIDRATGNYGVRYRADQDSAEEVLSGRFTLPDDVYSGMLGVALKNLSPGESATVQIVVFTPQPRLVKVLLAPHSVDQLTIGERPITTTRYTIKPQLGMLASLLVVDVAPVQCWVLKGDAPAFIKFEGPLYFIGPVWRIELN